MIEKKEKPYFRDMLASKYINDIDKKLIIDIYFETIPYFRLIIIDDDDDDDDGCVTPMSMKSSRMNVSSLK